jgi:nitroreductase
MLVATAAPARSTRMATTDGFDLAQTDRLLTTTRAVRRRLDLDRPVEREVVLDCLRIATQAPSGGNTQPWRWLVIDDPDLRAGLADLYRQAWAPYIEMQKAAVRAAGGDDDRAIIRSADFLAEHLHEVPVHVIPCLLDRLPERPSPADTARRPQAGRGGHLLERVEAAGVTAAHPYRG